MTDARLPDPWLGNPKFGSLSDGAWRLFTHALMWSNRYGTDGAVDRRFYPHLLVEGDTTGQILEMMDLGLALPTHSGFMIPWEEFGQSPAHVIEKTRANNRERKARQLEREGTRELTRERTRESMREVGQDRLGEEDIF